MTLGRLIMILIAALIMLVSRQLGQNIPVWLTVLCSVVGCAIGGYPNMRKLLRERKEGRLTRKSPIVKAVIFDAIWAVFIITFVGIDWYRT